MVSVTFTAGLERVATNAIRIDFDGRIITAASFRGALARIFEERDDSGFNLYANPARVRIGDCTLATVRAPHAMDLATEDDVLAGALRYDERAYEAGEKGLSIESDLYRSLAATLRAVHLQMLTPVTVTSW